MESKPGSIADWAKQNAGRFEFDPQIQHHFSDAVYAKQVHIPAGAMIVSHKHNYSHLSLLAQGAVIVETDTGEPQHYRAPTCIEIKAGVHHAVHALTDTVWFCIHHTDCKDPDKIDEVLIQK